MPLKCIPILLVEDEPDDVEILRFQFNELNIPTKIKDVSSSEEAIAFLRKGKSILDPTQAGLPALIILDLFLPGENGLRTLERIKAEPAWQEIPVIILTASGDKEHQKESYRKGCVLFLRKPCDVKTWHEAITHLRFSKLLTT